MPTLVPARKMLLRHAVRRVGLFGRAANVQHTARRPFIGRTFAAGAADAPADAADAADEEKPYDGPMPRCAQKWPYKIAFTRPKKALKDTAKVGSDRVSWCSCGLSHRQPKCDGRHKGTEYKPIRYRHIWADDDPPTVERWLCGCKLTQNPPWCDGSHNSLDDDPPPETS